jgi:hypothetical protein
LSDIKAKSVPKQNIEDDLSEGGRSRASTRTFKDTENQYFNEKMNKLNRYYGNKNQRQFEVISTIIWWLTPFFLD